MKKKKREIILFDTFAFGLHKPLDCDSTHSPFGYLSSFLFHRSSPRPCARLRCHSFVLSFYLFTSRYRFVDSLWSCTYLYGGAIHLRLRWWRRRRRRWWRWLRRITLICDDCIRIGRADATKRETNKQKCIQPNKKCVCVCVSDTGTAYVCCVHACVCVRVVSAWAVCSRCFALNRNYISWNLNQVLNIVLCEWDGGKLVAVVKHKIMP